MKKIVRGNDFVLRIPVAKVVSGEQFAFNLPSCSLIEVSLVSAYKRYVLAWEISTEQDNVLLATVEGDTMPCGTYALQVRGKQFGADWRSNEYEQIRLVENNAEADTDLSGVDEGEPSVEVDTQLIVMGAMTPALTPCGVWTEGTAYKRGDTVAWGLCTWWSATENTGSEPAKDNTDWVLLLDAKAAGIDKITLKRNRLTVLNTHSTEETAEADTAAALMAINAAKDATSAAAAAELITAAATEAVEKVEKAYAQAAAALAEAQEAVTALQNISFALINNRVEVTC